MSSRAIRSRRQPRAFAVVAGSVIAVLATLGASSARAQGVGPAEAGPYAKNFPNVVLKTHEGNTVRFYDDLLKDKIVLINFMYATCEER